MPINICWCVCTYNRSHLLPRIIACFEAQTHAHRSMLILEDGNQFLSQEGDDGRWQLVSVPSRYPSLGSKRNACVAIARERFPNIDAIACADDDDIPLPWHSESAAKALECAQWSRPSVILSVREIGDTVLFQANYTGNRDDQTKNRLYHPSWHFTVAAFDRVGGYPNEYSGPEDRELMHKMEAAGITEADPIEMGFPPSYGYVWGNSNISGRLGAHDPTGAKAWQSLGKTLEPVHLERWEPTFDLHAPLIAPGVFPRPF